MNSTSDLSGIDGEPVRCRSTGSGPEPLGPELVAEGQKPKGIALSALVDGVGDNLAAASCYESALLALNSVKALGHNRREYLRETVIAATN